MLTEQSSKARSRMALEARRAKRDPSDAEAQRLATEARRDFYAVRLADHIKSVVESAPPLTDDQCVRIAALLRPSAGGGRVD